MCRNSDFVFLDVTPPVFENCPNGTVFTNTPGVYDISEFAEVRITTCTLASGQLLTDAWFQPGVRLSADKCNGFSLLRRCLVILFEL